LLVLLGQDTIYSVLDKYIQKIDDYESMYMYRAQHTFVLK